MPLYQTRRIAPAPATKSTPALYYADPVEGVDSMGERVLPRFYVDVTGTFEKKLEMLSRHQSQRDWLRAHHGIDEYLEQARRWGASYGRESGFGYAEGLRQHLGHGYPREPLLQNALNLAPAAINYVEG
jgi:hypothetical protein